MINPRIPLWEANARNMLDVHSSPPSLSTYTNQSSTNSACLAVRNSNYLAPLCYEPLSRGGTEQAKKNLVDVFTGGMSINSPDGVG